jgi:hypothetical protein
MYMRTNDGLSQLEADTNVSCPPVKDYKRQFASAAGGGRLGRNGTTPGWTARDNANPGGRRAHHRALLVQHGFWR